IVSLAKQLKDTMDTVAPSPSPSHPAVADLAATADRLRLSATRLARILRQQSDAGLTPTQLAALATLERCGPIPIGTLADVEQVAAPTATKVVDKLHAAGLVQRLADPADRRVSRVSLTDAGAALLAEVRDRKTAWLATRLADLTTSDIGRLTDALEVLEGLTTPLRGPR
ncbi:MAG: transcriptional regulator, MarR family, partial [Acidimicrobiales bacterium]|nr:transcriptional regulator, MarR family [Acidimicrobiales bacterium]